MLRLPSVVPFSPVTLCGGIVGALALIYIGLIALIMTSAVLTIEFAQSVKNTEAAVAALEARYLASVATISATSYPADGYATPLNITFVTAENVAVLR